MRSGLIGAAVVFTGLLCWFGLNAQQQPPPPPYTDDPQTVDILNRIAKQTARLTPLLDQVHAQEWVAKGASETYVAQLESIRAQVQAVGTEMAGIAQHPDNMPECLRGLFRVQTLHGSMQSLMGGLRRYQNAALADLIESVASEDQGELEKLQNHILDLANRREQEYLIADHEAQRCRAEISRDPPKNTKRTTSH
ncbi:MAG TPA: hypothetical protein VKB79_29250 [Bryobacteraceae bacterium]|nr:hypothetical protein [Bryobacteraceae bacterium]